MRVLNRGAVEKLLYMVVQQSASRALNKRVRLPLLHYLVGGHQRPVVPHKLVLPLRPRIPRLHLLYTRTSIEAGGELVRQCRNRERHGDAIHCVRVRGLIEINARLSW